MKVGKLLSKAQHDTEVCIINQNDVKTHSGTKELLFDTVKDFKVVDYAIYNSCIYVMVKEKYITKNKQKQKEKAYFSKEEVKAIIGNDGERKNIGINNVYIHQNVGEISYSDQSFSIRDESGRKMMWIYYRNIEMIYANHGKYFSKNEQQE